MSGTYPVQASALRKGGYVMINNNPCKIVSMSTSKTGKHGHAKVNFTGIDIFTGDKNNGIQGSTHNMDVPNVTRVEYTLTDIDEGYLVLMDDSGDIKEDLTLPPNDLGPEIQNAFDNLKDEKEILVTVLGACDKEQVISYKLSKI